MAIEFIVNGDAVNEPVTAELIARSIRSLTGDGDSFAILARDKHVYLQTSGDSANGFVMEYRDGSESEHYACANSELTADEVIQAMQRYLENDSRWKTDIEWQPHDFGSAAITINKGLIVGLFAVLAAAALIWTFVTA